MSKLTKSQLQKVLDDLSAAHNMVKFNRGLLANHCDLVYGVDPSDVHNDQFIDRCDGGAGKCSGMTVNEFHTSMQECMKRHKIEMPLK
jgi:hypothetical protein